MCGTLMHYWHTCCTHLGPQSTLASRYDTHFQHHMQLLGHRSPPWKRSVAAANEHVAAGHGHREHPGAQHHRLQEHSNQVICNIFSRGCR